jgi:hypothetical protein
MPDNPEWNDRLPAGAQQLPPADAVSTAAGHSFAARKQSWHSHFFINKENEK